MYTALDDAVLANLAEVTELDDLEQGVLMTEYERPAATPPMVAPSFCACLTRGVREDGTAGSQVNRECCLVAAVANFLGRPSSWSRQRTHRSRSLAEQSFVQHDVPTTPSLTCRHFHALLPISRMKSNVWNNALAPRGESDKVQFARVCTQLNQDTFRHNREAAHEKRTRLAVPSRR